MAAKRVFQKGVACFGTMLTVLAAACSAADCAEMSAEKGCGDCTEALQKQLDGDAPVFLPSGTYRVSRTLELRDGASVCGEPGTRIVMLGTGSVFRASGRLDKDRSLHRASGFTFRDLTVEASSILRNRHAFCLASVENGLIERVDTIGMGGLWVKTVYPVNVWDRTPDPPGTAGMHGDASLSSNIVVKACTFDGGNLDMAWGVNLEYVSDFEVRDCVALNLKHGFQFWGGDSFHERGGLLENEKRCRRGRFVGCRAYCLGGGGIWGGMAEDILVTNCQAAVCFDVGIDFEGCHRCEAVDCRVRDCKNGNLSTFMFCLGDVAFRRCFSEFTKRYEFNCHFFHSNSTQRRAEQRVTIEDCVFTSVRPSLVRAQSAMKEFSFVGNVCTNVIFDPRANNMGRVVCERNVFVPSLPSGGQK